MAHFARIGGVVRQALTRSSPLGASHGAFAMPALCAANRGMASTLFIGGLSWGLDEGTIRDAFSSFGEVREVRIVVDRETGRSKGYGFVTYCNDADAEGALQAMDGRELSGREIRVNYATRDVPGKMNPGFTGGYR